MEGYMFITAIIALIIILIIASLGFFAYKQKLIPFKRMKRKDFDKYYDIGNYPKNIRNGQGRKRSE